MHFKKFERVEYEKNILFEVVFQARFPEIMKISHEQPVDFQDIISLYWLADEMRDIDILVNNVGIYDPELDYDTMMDVNMKQRLLERLM